MNIRFTSLEMAAVMLLAGVMAPWGGAGASDAKGNQPPMVVTTASDVVDGDVSSTTALIATPGADGAISLREAIMAANAAQDGDTITFSGVGSIFVMSELPELSDATLGTSIDGAGAVTIINGTGQSDIDGLRIVTGGNEVRGLTFNGFSAGIRISGAGALSNVVAGCVLGNVAQVVTKGVTFENQTGLVIEDGASTNTIGGTQASEGNTISGNDGDGVILMSGASDNLLLNNFIGTDGTGMSAIPNGGDGIRIDNASANFVGNAISASGNVISGNTGAGVRITGGATGNAVERSTIGVAADLFTPLPNGSGVLLENGVSGNVIGSTLFQGGNIIGGNLLDGVGISDGGENIIQNNFIGTSRSLFTDLGNIGAGIRMTGTSVDNALGTIAGFGNVVSFNQGGGIVLDGANVQRNPIRENSLYNNTGPGIELLNGAQEGIQPPALDAVTVDQPLTGATLANATVEVFLALDTEEGFDFIGSTVSDSKGEFSITVPVSNFSVERAVATVTDSTMNTSAFSDPVLLPVVLEGDSEQLFTFFYEFDENRDEQLDATELVNALGRDAAFFSNTDRECGRLRDVLRIAERLGGRSGFRPDPG